MTLQSIWYLDCFSDDANVLTMGQMTGHVSQYHVELIMKSLNQSASARPLVPIDSLVDRALAAASCQLSPGQLLRWARVQVQFWPELRSCRPGLYTVHLYSGWDCTTVRGPGLGPRRVISLDTAIVSSTQSQPVSLHSVITEWERESPAQGSVHRLAPVLVCSELTCVRPLRAQTARITNWKWKSEENLSL